MDYNDDYLFDDPVTQDDNGYIEPDYTPGEGSFYNETEETGNEPESTGG